MCKRNLFYGEVVHNCEFGLGLGKIHPEMNPEFLINLPWWVEPLLVQQQNNYVYLDFLQRLLLGFPFYPYDTTQLTETLENSLIAELD